MVSEVSAVLPPNAFVEDKFKVASSLTVTEPVKLLFDFDKVKALLPAITTSTSGSAVTVTLSRNAKS